MDGLTITSHDSRSLQHRLPRGMGITGLQAARGSRFHTKYNQATNNQISPNQVVNDTNSEYSLLRKIREQNTDRSARTTRRGDLGRNKRRGIVGGLDKRSDGERALSEARERLTRLGKNSVQSELGQVPTTRSEGPLRVQARPFATNEATTPLNLT